MGKDAFQLVGTCLDGKFQVDKCVAEGGFAVVYSGQHLSLDRPIAIKVLKTPPELNERARQEFISKFRLEAKTIARLSHLNIVQVIEFGVSRVPSGEDAPWMVLEWLTGRSLEQELAGRRGKGGRAPEEALKLLEPIFDALAYAHEEGIAHRDVKPANIMIVPTKRGEMLKLLDFGIVKIMQKGETAEQALAPTRGVLSAHSPAYAAPEQITGLRTGPWTDVHALALLLTEVMTDLPPYDGKNITTLLREILSPQRPTPARHQVDAGPWETVLGKALALEPADRFKNASEFLDALKSAVPAQLKPVALPSEPIDLYARTDVRPPPRPAVETQPLPDWSATPSSRSAVASQPPPASSRIPLRSALESQPLPASSPSPSRSALESQPLRASSRTPSRPALELQPLPASSRTPSRSALESQPLPASSRTPSRSALELQPLPVSSPSPSRRAVASPPPPDSSSPLPSRPAVASQPLPSWSFRRQPVPPTGLAPGAIKPTPAKDAGKQIPIRRKWLASAVAIVALLAIGGVYLAVRTPAGDKSPVKPEGAHQPAEATRDPTRAPAPRPPDQGSPREATIEPTTPAAVTTTPAVTTPPPVTTPPTLPPATEAIRPTTEESRDLTPAAEAKPAAEILPASPPAPPKATTRHSAGTLSRRALDKGHREDRMSSPTGDAGAAGGASVKRPADDQPGAIGRRRSPESKPLQRTNIDLE